MRYWRLLTGTAGRWALQARAAIFLPWLPANYLLERFPHRCLCFSLHLCKMGRITSRAPDKAERGSLCCKTSAGVHVLCEVAVIEVFCPSTATLAERDPGLEEGICDHVFYTAHICSRSPRSCLNFSACSRYVFVGPWSPWKRQQKILEDAEPQEVGLRWRSVEYGGQPTPSFPTPACEGPCWSQRGPRVSMRNISEPSAIFLH